MDKITISQDEFSAEIGISKRQVQNLVRSGVLPIDKEGHLLHRAALAAYQKYTEQGAPKSVPKAPIPDAGDLEQGAKVNEIYKKSRAALMSYKAKKAKQDFELEAGELHTNAEIEAGWGALCEKINSALDGVAARCAPRCEGKTARDIEEVIDKEIQDAKNWLRKNPI